MSETNRWLSWTVSERSSPSHHDFQPIRCRWANGETPYAPTSGGTPSAGVLFPRVVTAEPPQGPFRIAAALAGAAVFLFFVLVDDHRARRFGLLVVRLAVF